jgi:DNA-binding GntR family transcriptional regulator
MIPASSQSLTQGAFEALRADVLASRLRPGERLKINQLCERLGVSLSAVREALSRLTAEGLVIAEPQRGFRVAPISADELGDLTRVRIEIEALCLRSAIRAGDINWETGIVASFHKLNGTPERAPGDPERLSDDWSLAHQAFHQSLVASCDSRWLLRLRAILYAQSERYRQLSVPLAETKRDVRGEHQEIVDATLARDAERAVVLLSNHFERTTSILLRAAWADPISPA